MKVSELIELLKELDQDREIAYSDSENGNTDIEIIKTLDSGYLIY